MFRLSSCCYYLKKNKGIVYQILIKFQIFPQKIEPEPFNVMTAKYTSKKLVAVVVTCNYFDYDITYVIYLLLYFESVRSISAV